jgi:hypothetical protein
MFYGEQTLELLNHCRDFVGKAAITAFGAAITTSGLGM